MPSSGSSLAAANEPPENPEIAALQEALASRDACLRAIAEVCRKASRGDLEPRLLVQHGEVEGITVDAVNDLLDVVDAFVREAGVSLTCAAEDCFDRRLLEGGLDGAFLQAAHAINGGAAKMEERANALSQARQDRYQLAMDFEESVGRVVSAIASASTELHATASGLGTSAETTRELADDASREVTEVASLIGHVTQATSTLTEATNLIGQGTRQGAQETSAAQSEIRDGEASVNALETSSTRISEVVAVIRSIAQQTNLLALNASIEAARAGEAGRGFGVVATEVKELARQTSKATVEVAERVTEIRASARAVGQAFSSVRGAIDTVHTNAQAIESAVDEHHTTAAAVAASLGEVQEKTDIVSDRTAHVAQDAAHTASAVGDVSYAADELSRQAEQLRNDSERFLERIRG